MHKPTPKLARQLTNPVDQVMQTARKRHCPIARLTAAVTEAVCAELKDGKGTPRIANARRLHHDWERLLRRHLLAIVEIRRGGENLLKLEEEILTFADARGLITRASGHSSR